MWLSAYAPLRPTGTFSCLTFTTIIFILTLPPSLPPPQALLVVNNDHLLESISSERLQEISNPTPSSTRSASSAPSPCLRSYGAMHSELPLALNRLKISGKGEKLKHFLFSLFSYFLLFFCLYFFFIFLFHFFHFLSISTFSFSLSFLPLFSFLLRLFEGGVKGGYEGRYNGGGGQLQFGCCILSLP